jgi:hypothetical protein
MEADLTGLNGIERMILAAVSVLLVSFIALTLLTSGFWLRLDKLSVADACAGATVPLYYDRTFVRDFHGEWLVSVWRLDHGEWGAWGSARGAWDYLAASPAKSRDLAWLVSDDPRTSRLPPGTYRVNVSITANPDTIFSRTATVQSNPFEVQPCSN